MCCVFVVVCVFVLLLRAFLLSGQPDHKSSTKPNKALSEGHRGVIVPPLPEKSAVQKFQMGAEFVEERRRALQVGSCVCCVCVCGAGSCLCVCVCRPYHHTSKTTTTNTKTKK